jgi:hypothetical protein
MATAHVESAQLRDSQQHTPDMTQQWLGSLPLSYSGPLPQIRGMCNPSNIY